MLKRDVIGVKTRNLFFPPAGWPSELRDYGDLDGI